MANICAPAGAAGTRFATQLLADADCQAFGLVERGYAALAEPGGTISTAITGLLIIAVATFGYRLLLGRGLALSEALKLTIRIGVVLLLATSWEAWQALAYRGLAQIPTEVASNVLMTIGGPAPLDSLQQTLDKLTQAAVGYRSRAGIASPLVGGPAAAGAVLNLSSVILTLSTVGILVAARVVQAVLLAIAPAMAGLLLFDSTRGMAQGWLGSIAAAALAPLFVLLIAAIEFAILGPMIARLLAEQAAGTFENTSVMPIGLIAVVFSIAIALAMRTVARIGYGLRLDARSSKQSNGPAASDRTMDQTAQAPSRRLASDAPVKVARTLEQIARREAASGGGRSSYQRIGMLSASSAARDTVGAPMGSIARRASAPAPTTSGTTRLRSAPRRSRAAVRRDS